MTTETTSPHRVCCPACEQKGKRVSPVTLRALLKEEQASGFAGGEPAGCTADRDTGWRFCESQDCDVVYFSEDGRTKFTKSALKVAVGVKETNGERMLCYCFGHSIASIKDELRAQGRSAALEDIQTKMKDPGCRCITENPSGSCCLGSVGKGIRIAREELGMNRSETKTRSMRGGLLAGKGESIAKIGTVVSAIMASACCWLPLLLLAAGISGAGIASTLEAYRPLFIVVTFSFLGAAFFFAYRPRNTAAANGIGCCATEPSGDEDCCAPARKRRFNMPAFNKAMLWVVTVMAIAFLFFPSYVGAFLGGGNGKLVTKNMNRAVFKIEGMTCEGCSALVAKAIEAAPGVLAVEVNYKKGEAVVGAEIGCPIPQAPILAALKEAGYRGQIVADSVRQGAPPKPTPKPKL